MSATAAIGRFNIIREISKGGQGTVYLADDPQLERQVAVKMLRTTSPQQKESLLREARITSKFQHPNIVTLHDAGEHEGVPYLVYAFIEGETLAQMLKRCGTLPLAQAARLVAGVLDGLAYAHQQGVMHLDIKPANVIVAANGQPMLLDFGIARHVGNQADAAGGVDGTPQYMAPERITSQGAEFRSDIFSVGIMLYEMVTGKPAVGGDTIFQVLHRAAHEQVAAPSSLNAEIDERLEVIILKAVAKKPDDRYPDAATMRQALLNYLDATQEGDAAQGGADTHSTLDFLLRRMRSKSDFPALSGTISEINKIVSSESEGPSKLAKVILQDFALTNKLLKLVNTVSFGQFGGNINTISKAVVILGFDTVRNIAMTLILLEFLQNKSQAVELKDEVIASFFAGILAAELSGGGRPGEAEEAMICAMFHNLGRLLATFYFFEESRQVVRLMEDQGMGEEQAAIKVLGMSYSQLGSGVAESWNFPHRLVAGMKKLPADKVRKPHGDLDQLSVTVNLANELCMVSAITDVKEKSAQLQKLCARYEGATHVSEKKLSSALESGLNDLSQRSGILGIISGKSPLIKRIRKWSGNAEPTATGIGSMEGVTLLDTVTPEAIAQTPAQFDPDAILSAGIQDVTNTLVEDYKLNDVLLMVLETVYRSLGFKHTLIFIRDNRQNAMLARFGFGAHVDAILPRLKFSLAFVPDVFHLAIDKGADIVIEDVQAGTISDKIPKWYRDSIDAQCFLLLPIMVNKKAVGLIYADMQDANSLKISERQLSLLRTLRNQAVLAIKQKLP
ncbi:MAG: serine/threonine protein kinase [Gallionellaceae bacterium]|nr:MAG: serine/threonine protein kinase [Gallionellaceae bacterium]